MIDREALLRIYRDTKTIAAVGASRDAERPGHEIPRYLHTQGYRVIPVTPRAAVLFDEQTRPSLRELDVVPDVVDVFRPPEDAQAIAEDAIAIGAKVLWFQPGTETRAAVERARDAGLAVVWGRCMGTTHAELGLGPGPWR